MTTELPSRKRIRDTTTETTCSHRRTRSRLTPPLAADSSSTSEPSISSDTSALIPTSVPEDSTDATGAEHDSDTESDLSESSEDPSSDSSSDNGSNIDSDDAESDNEAEMSGDGQSRVNLPANRGKKPVMKLRKKELGEDMRPWLKEFLPRLRAANEELEKERVTGTLKDKMIEREDGEGQYIEMDLGLGVLEERDPNAQDSSESEGDSEEDDTDTQAQKSKKEKDILGKLMGRENKPVSIQEVNNTLEKK